MKLVEQHVIERSHAKFGQIDAMAFASKLPSVPISTLATNL